MASRITKKNKGGSGAGGAVVWILTRVVLPLAIVYGVLWWRVDAGIDKQIAKLRPYMDVKRGTTVLGLNGDIGFRDLVMTPAAGSGMPDLRVTADRAVVRTPGLWWVLKAAVAGVPDDEIPSRIGIALEGSGFDGSPAAKADAMLGGSVLFPFDFAGCEPTLSPAVLQSMGLAQAKSDFAVTLERPASGPMRMVMDVDTDGAMGMQAVLTLQPGPGNVQMQLAMAQFQSLAVTLQDKGFVAARNRHCEQKLQVDTDTFVRTHLDAVKAMYAAQGVLPGAAMTQSYENFTRNGGTLVVQLKPLRPGPLLQMQGATLTSLGMYFDATIKHDNGFTAPLTFLRADQYAPATPAAPAAVPTTDAPVAGPAADAAPAAAPVLDGPRVSVGEEIPRETLPAYLGSRVEVATRMGTRRIGELTGASSISIIVRLDPSEGGFPLSMPMDTITSVRLAGPANATAENSDDAQAQ